VREESGRDYPRVIDHQEFVTPQEGWQFPKTPVCHCPSAAFQQEHTGGCAILKRLLGNQLGRQDIVKFS
jgi:hypothetical protein